MPRRAFLFWEGAWRRSQHSARKKGDGPLFWLQLDNTKVHDNRIGFGLKSALVLVDCIEAYTNRSSPFHANGAALAARESVVLLSAARAAQIPIFHVATRFRPSDVSDAAIWVKKMAALELLQADNPLSRFCPEVAPISRETVIVKQVASAFFGTNLALALRARGVDTIVLAGASTSGSIRATAVDGFQYGFRVMVVRDCVGDCGHAPHDASLRDIDRNYGDVIHKKDALDAFSAGAPRSSLELKGEYSADPGFAECWS
ncbi:isochorismatase family protein [Hyphomicrobium sp. ghe19]|uniref:isochorismatase family protein n=1 Tax=Hyphomicrobium sp. ghe19 TaxID=2682968 RepID=UPI0030D05E41